ncbi:MBL fold metallo-hydrolase [Maribacter algarum]|uniref:MBL fold metallo-hydrolase n=1 Tax=Maribacter algarum (ex Zhang et al. 2020) TaxID=2578118 RepID=A0A5S3PZ41_9FLAO|nr:MBL fold metallo-hydrolase [Maribacter algarum]TMM59552.1 MBL fold metallo-hydrolase [Maribacter algarum]
MKASFLTFLFTFTSIFLVNAQDKEVIITVDTLSQNVYMLTGQGGNIGIYVGESNVFMIDDQFDRLSKKIQAAIANLTDKPIATLFNTHMHGDHSGGNAKFNSDAVILVAHDNVRDRIKATMQAKLDKNEITADYLAKMLPEVTFSEDITFYDGDETIMAFHVHNAHTDGDAMVYFMNNNVLHMGDTYFSGRYPYMDLKSGGSVNGYIEAHKKALMVINEDTRIIPGHGRPSSKKELETYVAMLEDIRGKIQAAIDADATLEDVKANAALTEAYDTVHGNGFISPERFRETVYNSLKEK